MNFGGYFIHPILPMSAIFLLGLTVPVGGISMMVYEDKEEKCQKKLDTFNNELDESQEKLDALIVSPKPAPTIANQAIIATKENSIQKNNNVKRSR